MKYIRVILGELYVSRYWIMVRVFAIGLGDLRSIQIELYKRLKMVVDPSLLNTQHYKIRIKVKWSNPGKGVMPYPTPWCSSHRKGSPRVTLDYGHQLLLIRFKFIVRPVGVFCEVCLAEAATNRTHNLPLSRVLGEHVCYLLAAERTRSI